MKSNSSVRTVLVICGAVPFILSNATWSKPLLMVYLLTAVLFGILLVGEYPEVGTTSFWKSLVITGALHLVVVLGVLTLNLRFPEVNRLPLVAYGGVAFLIVIEWKLFLRIIECLHS